MSYPVTDPAPGKSMLKVTGIIMIVFSAVALVSALIAAFALGAVAGAVGSLVGANVAAGAAGIAFFAVIFAFIPAILELVAGILAVKYCANPAKAQTLVVFAAIMLAIALISIILDFSIIGLVGFVLPILLLLGALKNKKAAQGASL